MRAVQILAGVSVTLNVALAAWLGFGLKTPFGGSDAPQAAAGARASAAPYLANFEDVAALIASGLEPKDAKDLAAGAAYSRYRDKMRSIPAPPPPDPRFWRNTSIQRPAPLPAHRDAQVEAERELAAALKAIYGQDVSLEGTPDLRLAFLPPFKQDALRDLEQDYVDFENDLLRESRRLALPTDEEKLAAIRAQKERELSQLLTPEERRQYDLRGSQRALSYMSTFGAGFETEDDFKTFVTAVQGHDDRFSGTAIGGGLGLQPVPAGYTSWAAAANADRARTYGEIQEKLGPEKYAALQYYRDNDRLQLESLRARVTLPAGTTEQVLALRQSYSLESKRIAGDPALTPQQRSQAVRELGARARADVIAVLGDEAGRAYTVRQQNWPELLSRGVAFTTDRTEMGGGSTGLNATAPFVARPAAP